MPGKVVWPQSKIRHVPNRQDKMCGVLSSHGFQKSWRRPFSTLATHHCILCFPCKQVEALSMAITMPREEASSQPHPPRVFQASGQTVREDRASGA